MTIIEPHKQKSRIIAAIILLLVIGGAGGLYAVSIYGDIVNLTHIISDREGSLSALQVRHADLQNKLYTILNPEVLEEQARERGLTLDARPRYLETGSSVVMTGL